MALSDVKVKPMKCLWNGQDLGSTSGGVEISVSNESVDIQLDQTGSAAQDSFDVGTTISVSLTLLELNTTNYNNMISSTIGSTHTPNAGTQVYSFGTDRHFTSMLSRCQTLELRPVGNTDSSESWSFWKSLPIPESLSFVSDAANSMSITFKIFPDATKTAAARIGVFGDNTQDFS